MASYLDVVLGPEDVPRPKPAPDMLRLALARLKLPAEEVLYIGDMVVDIQTARAAGVSVWVVPTGSDEVETLKRAYPDRLLRDLHQVAEFLAANVARQCPTLLLDIAIDGGTRSCPGMPSRFSGGSQSRAALRAAAKQK